MGAYDEKLRKRLWAKVRKRKSGCWEWTGSNSGGYGHVCVRGQTTQVHRLVWEWCNNKKIPSGMCVLHKCDNPSCVSPHHLFLGTRGDNIQDCVRKGRHCGGRAVTRLRGVDGFVQCCRCRKFLHQSCFNADTRNKSHGCRSYCKKCDTASTREHRERKRRE